MAREIAATGTTDGQGSWAKPVIPETQIWYDNNSGDLTYYTIQVFSKHDRYQTYMMKVKNQRITCITLHLNLKFSKNCADKHRRWHFGSQLTTLQIIYLGIRKKDGERKTFLKTIDRHKAPKPEEEQREKRKTCISPFLSEESEVLFQVRSKTQGQ